MDMFTELLGFVDKEQLAYVDEPREGLNRGRLIQGDKSFEKDPLLNQTVRYGGGIGLSVEGLKEEIIKQGTIVTLNEKDFVTFPSLEVVVLTNSRIRRNYQDIDGSSRLVCGTNQDGAHAKGWRGLACKQCEFWPKNYVANGGKKQDACRAEIPVLVYIPAFDHVAILSFHGASYMEVTAWQEQLGKLARAFAQRTEVQAGSPGLARVNPWFFRTTISAGPFEKGEDNNFFQRLVYTKAEQPYQWEKVLNTPATLKRVKELWADLETMWKQLYVDHNPNAVLSLPTADASPAALPAQSGAVPALPQLESRVVVPAAEALPATPPGIPAAAPAMVPAMPSLPAAMPAIPLGSPATPVIPGVAVSTIALDDTDATPSVTSPLGF